MIYQSLNHSIDKNTLTVTNDRGEKVNVRPKTCQLLLLLLEHNAKPVNKKAILESVWAESVVSEQVVFQSINEIRQIFGSSQVIKTIPNQGYIWAGEVTILADKATRTAKLSLKMTAGLIALTAAVAIFISTLLDNPALSKHIPVSGSVVMLPTQNNINGNDHAWVRLGVMDQVIQRLPNGENYGVLQTDYVFEILKRANAPLSRIKTEHINQIFKTSGAELIIMSKLSGSPHDYQLNYQFHYRHGTTKGVLLDTDIQQLIINFSELIAANLNNKQTPLLAYQADFHNELLGNAIEKQLNGEYQQAQPLLESIVFSNPDNLTAQRMLVRNTLRLKQFDQAITLIDNILPLAIAQNDQHEITRLLYAKSLALYATYNDSQASVIAKQALNYATKNNDWLLMAYITNINANIAFNKQQYDLAESLYYQEQQYHKTLRCPVGETSTWASLARLAQHLNQPQKFEFAINKGINIARERELTTQFNYLQKLNKSHKNQ